MSTDRATIFDALGRVDALRRAREQDPALATRVLAVKQYQHDRFSRDYADLLSSPRFAAAARFFLEDLYGPTDFAARDAEFGRVLPAMTHLLPDAVLHTVEQLVDLHALSEDLDQAMARAVVSDRVDDQSYRAAWRAVGRQADRERQLQLLLAIGRALERHTRTPILATTLRLMRGPARAAGLARLQSFLERGLAAFTSMNGASEFLAAIAGNESAQTARLFSATT